MGFPAISVGLSTPTLNGRVAMVGVSRRSYFSKKRRTWSFQARRSNQAWTYFVGPQVSVSSMISARPGSMSARRSAM